MFFFLIIKKALKYSLDFFVKSLALVSFILQSLNALPEAHNILCFIQGSQMVYFKGSELALGKSLVSTIVLVNFRVCL